MSLQTSQILYDRYRIVKLLGQGGMGAVYRAWDLRLNTACALKENLDLSPASQQQFTREAYMLAQLSHPNLPRVIDYFTLAGQGQYLVMEFIEGQDLQQILHERGQLSEFEVLPYIQQVCDALNYLHAQQPPIIHRDIKPANVKITPQGRAILVDFGIAKVFETQHVTTQGARAITAGYSPPEQYGYGRTDARTDVYALGATLYALLTGQAPPESVHRLAGSTLPRPGNISAPVASATLRAMELDPNMRYQTARQFGEALTATSRTKLVAVPVGTRSWLLPAVVLAVVALLIAGVVIAPLLRPTPTPVAQVEPTARVIVVTSVVEPAPADPPTEPAVEPPAEPAANNPITVADEPPTTAPLPGDTVTPTPVMTPSPTPPRPTATPTAVRDNYTIGYSADNRALTAYQFGRGARAIVLLGGIHAGFAPNTVTLAERAVEYFTANPDQVPAGVTLYIVPNMNPDSALDPGNKPGRLNGNDVDLNRNWGCNWRADSTFRSGTIPVSGGSRAFSEPETEAVRDLIAAVDPAAVIIYDAKAVDGLVYVSDCFGARGGSDVLARVYRQASGYGAPSSITMGEGEIGDWLVSQGIPAVFVLLRDYEQLPNSEWTANLNGILATLAYYER